MTLDRLRALVETVVCLANRSHDDAAWLLIGVEDDGRVTGARLRHEAGKTDPIRVQVLEAEAFAMKETHKSTARVSQTRAHFNAYRRATAISTSTETTRGDSRPGYQEISAALDRVERGMPGTTCRRKTAHARLAVPAYAPRERHKRAEGA